GDQREDHDSGRPVDPAYLSKLGVLYRRCPSMSAVDAIAAQRSYKNRDEIIVSPETMGPAYDEKVKMFFNEHLHEDEEIRYVLDGEGFFDVRDVQDEWVRIRLEKGDLIVLPAGIYHRFTTDINNVSAVAIYGSHISLLMFGSEKYIKAMRLFKDEPKWTPLNRAPDLEKNPVRKEYVSREDEAHSA
ncbi:MAG: hypothetical protein Q9194_000708, partial [Teloschistes cf. exilis]